MSAKGMFYPEKKEFSEAEEKAFAREALVYNVTEDLLVIMENLEVSKKELSERLGKSKSFVSQVLCGARNMTLGTLSDVCFSLGIVPKVKLPVEEVIIENLVKSSLSWANELDETCEVMKVAQFVDSPIRKPCKVFHISNHKNWANLPCEAQC